MKNITKILGSLFIVLLLSTPSYAFLNTQNQEAALEFVVNSGMNEYTFQTDSTVTLGEFLKTLLVTSGWNPSSLSSPALQYTDVPAAYTQYVERARQLGLVSYNSENPILGLNNTMTVSRALELSLRYYGFSNPRFLINPTEFSEKVTNFNQNFVLSPLIERGLLLGLLESRNGQVNFFAPITRAELASLILNIRDIQSQILNGEFKPTPGFQIEVPVIGAGEVSPTFRANEQYQIFQDVYERIRTEYLNRENVDPVQLFYGAISGMVDVLGDANSAFLEPKVQEAFRDNLSNQIEGIGASLTIDENRRVVVVTPLIDSPAERAGIKSGDIITHVDGKAVQGLNLNQVVSKIQGPSGTNVRITVLRNNASLNFTITRAAISSPAVSGEITSNNVGIIALRNFGLGIENNFAGYVRQMKDANVKGVVIDLRNNPGGYLDSATRLAGHFVKSGEVISRINYAGSKFEESKTFGSADLAGKPIAVIVNKGTASASEILAAGLRDKAGAVIIGEPTFGKGTVQELITYTDNSALKLTVAKWLTANGTDIDKVGLIPSIRVFQTEADSRLGNDALLNRALQEVSR
jgi:carboxyl-terminal processing protease